MDRVAEGASLAQYRILEPLGAGGMGAVYKAYDERLDRVVALKVLPPELASHEDRRRRFLQEARAASALNHPHILTVFEVGEAQGQPYIVMEYIQGETLRGRIASHPLKLMEALELAIQVAAGLSKAHEHGIIHRDLKPENLMISRDGYAKILDFGLAKLIERERALSVNSTEKTVIHVKTQSGLVMGTINYMSPEQLLAQRVDTRSDIFSFGVVLYEMLTAERPFARGNDIDTMHAILHEEPALPRSIKPDLPQAIDRILFKALAKSPEARYQTIKEMAAELKSLKRDIETGRAERPRTRLVLKPVSSASQARARIDYEKELNESQLLAATTVNGPLLIVAGAGTGKTRTLVYRLARLIELGVKPDSVLLLTFTRRAATSMLARAASLADQRCQRVSGGTFHSLAHSTLRRHAEMAGMHQSFTVLDQGDTEDVIDIVRRQIGINTKDRHFPRKRTIAEIFSMAANKTLTIEEALDRFYPHFAHECEDLKRLMSAFEQYKRARNLLTYDDLLIRLRAALEESEALRVRLSNQYRYIMVDEYQDTNRLQAQIVRLMAATHDNVAVVGDECQSIYSFRGASFENMLEFPKLFPDAQVIKLERNYRSTQPVLAVANALISGATEGYGKQLFSPISDGPPPVLVSARDENEQSRFVAQRIEELREEGVPLHEIAVLFRAGSHSFDLEIELGKLAIPFRKFGGIKFVESAHIKDVLAFLRVLVNPSDTISWFRVLKLVDHIGDATVQRILDYLDVERKEFRTAKAKENLFKRLKQYPAKAAYEDQLVRLAHLLETLVDKRLPSEQLSAVARFYRPILRASHDDYPRRQRDLEHLAGIAKRYKNTAELLADVALDPVDMALAESVARGQGYVTLSTVHSAKGLEWDTLFIIWAVDGSFPSSRTNDVFEDVEEERRLLYVATTRAKRNLYYVCPESSYGGAVANTFPAVSRFLEIIPDDILARAALHE